MSESTTPTAPAAPAAPAARPAPLIEVQLRGSRFRRARVVWQRDYGIQELEDLSTLYLVLIQREAALMSLLAGWSRVQASREEVDDTSILAVLRDRLVTLEIITPRGNIPPNLSARVLERLRAQVLYETQARHHATVS